MVAVLSDTARVLVDLQRDESLTRRLIITANINPALKETLNSTSMDEWLFGKNLEESLKTAKLIERSSKELKPVSKGNTGPKPKNSKVPPQQPPRARVKSGGGSRNKQLQVVDDLQPGVNSEKTLLQEANDVERLEELQEVIEKESTSSVATTFPGGRSLVQQAYAARGIPAEALNVTMASLSDSSMRQYDVNFKKWWEFCRLTQTEILKAGKANVLRFLSSEFDKGASYGSINSMRSAVALLLGPEIGQDLNTKRFCSGASRLRPAQPKYDVSWDPKSVLKFLGGWFPNEKLALEKLSLKLVTLLALTTGHRM
ncbi:uncharacterized protein LOC141534654 [Cotesia typhae]|uniref:uncharacterized protein LOC141534654 n=1 Tax=Cotesia typhae TaxID=2053667 RepID=UPI003D696625